MAAIPRCLRQPRIIVSNYRKGVAQRTIGLLAGTTTAPAQQDLTDAQSSSRVRQIARERNNAGPFRLSFLAKEAAPDVLVARQIRPAYAVVGETIGFLCDQWQSPRTPRIGFGSLP